MELETHLLLAGRLAYVPVSETEKVLGLTAEVGRMLAGLTKNLKKTT